MQRELSILTEKQRAVVILRDQGLTYKQISEELGISEKTVAAHLQRAERRFREYEQYHAWEKRNEEIVPLEVTRGEWEIILEAIRLLERELIKEAHLNVATDWRGRLPYRAKLTAALNLKVQTAIYGSVVLPSVLSKD